MSELISQNISNGRRRYFLTTASALAIMTMWISEADAGVPAESRPTVWIELGGQLEHLGRQSDDYIPPFAQLGIQNGLISPAIVQKPSSYSLGEQGSVAFQPSGSEWLFAISVRYGRSSSKKGQHQELRVPGIPNVPGYLPTQVRPYGPNAREIYKTADYTANFNESHTIVDFHAGKDVGLGMSLSHFDVGIRFAQFTSRSRLNLLADPDPHLGFKYFPSRHASFAWTNFFQFYRAKPDIGHSFSGVGPSLAWSGSVPLLGPTGADASLALDVGVNASVLFGRQKVSIHHHTTADLISVPPLKYHDDRYTNYNHTARTRGVVVPNIGGTAGLSLNVPNARVSIGYRADFFIGAMDGGIDTHTSYDRNFYGPFATISIGLGG